MQEALENTTIVEKFGATVKLKIKYAVGLTYTVGLINDILQYDTGAIHDLDDEPMDRRRGNANTALRAGSWPQSALHEEGGRAPRGYVLPHRLVVALH